MQRQKRARTLPEGNGLGRLPNFWQAAPKYPTSASSSRSHAPTAPRSFPVPQHPQKGPHRVASCWWYSPPGYSEAVWSKNQLACGAEQPPLPLLRKLGAQHHREVARGTGLPTA